MKNNKWQVCICGAIKCNNEYLMVKRRAFKIFLWAKCRKRFSADRK